MESISWNILKTAYGPATTIPDLLEQLQSQDESVALRASRELWNALAHQHSAVYSAALPAYPIMRDVLKTSSDALKVEILDTMYGFVVCLKAEKNLDAAEPWKKELWDEIKKDIELYKQLSTSDNEDIQFFAKGIIELI